MLEDQILFLRKAWTEEAVTYKSDFIDLAGVPLAPKPLQKPYDWYSFKILPRLGQFIAGDAASYQYLAESIRMHPDQETLKQMLVDAGLERVEYFNLAAGVVALHRGYKF